MTIDIPDRTLAVALTDDEIDRRLDERETPEPAYTNGVLAKYGQLFGSAANGAITNPGPTSE